jgi:hypothetical protein
MNSPDDRIRLARLMGMAVLTSPARSKRISHFRINFIPARQDWQSAALAHAKLRAAPICVATWRAPAAQDRQKIGISLPEFAVSPRFHPPH